MSAARLAAAIATIVILAPAVAHAHDFSPGVLALAERGPGEYDLAWTEPVDSSSAPAGVTLVLPDGCERTGDVLRCAHGLRGTLAFAGMHEPRMLVIVSILGRDGSLDEYRVTGAAPSVELGEGGAAGRSMILWLRLGVEHILGGLDHLAFVLGLLLVLEVRADRRLLATITAFTLAHSLTLVLASLDLVRLASAPVEASIAASVLLVAREALSDRATAMRRWPWLVAGVFGLVHGLGFAGALSGLGLPQDALARSLLLFNLGVELGQLAVVGVVLALVRAAGRYRDRLAWVHPVACYLIGTLAAWWLVGRTIAILS